MPFSEGVSTHETTLQELKDETNLEKKRTVWLFAINNYVCCILLEIMTKLGFEKFLSRKQINNMFIYQPY